MKAARHIVKAGPRLNQNWRRRTAGYSFGGELAGVDRALPNRGIGGSGELLDSSEGALTADRCGRRLHPVAAAFLCAIERIVGGLQYELRIIPGLGESRHSDGNGDAREVLFEISHSECLNLPTQLLGPFHGDLDRCAGQNDDEFFTAEPAGDILFAEDGLEAFANLAQYRIAGVVTVVVIELLEVVDMD